MTNFNQAKTARLLMVALTLTTSVGFAAENQSNDTSRIQQIVRSYIMQHPEVVLESLQAFQLRAQQAQKQAARESVEANLKDLHSGSPVAGDAKSADAVTVVEFFDYRCGYCKKMEDVVAGLAKKPGVRVVYKDLPILGPESVLASQAALAAEKQGAYLAFHQRLMTAPEITAASIDQIAVELKLDTAQLKKDMASAEVAAALKKNQALAEKIGINATPSFVIGTDLAPGALEPQAFEAAIEKARGASKSAQVRTSRDAR